MIRNLINNFFESPSETRTNRGDRYLIMKRKIAVSLIIITLVPLSIMAVINYHQYRESLKKEITTPVYNVVNDIKYAFEIFIEERLSTIRFISTAYDYEELKKTEFIKKIFRALKNEFNGFIDLGLINEQGILESYVGPYNLLGNDYSKQESFKEISVSGSYISDVFLGYRKIPHIVYAVEGISSHEQKWFLRATLDTKKYEELLESIKVASDSDVFLVNKSGIMQTSSRYYGKVMEKCSLNIPDAVHGVYVEETKDNKGREILAGYSNIHSEYIFVIVKPKSVILKSWHTLKSKMFLLLGISVIIIIITSLRLSNIVTRRIKIAEERRETAMKELQHTQKLSSIGRLAAGVAHEINNPLAIINEKAGLMKDIISFSDDFKHKDNFLEQNESIINSVKRCRSITHRLLGFARRIDINFEKLDINLIIKEVLGFVEKEASYKQIDIKLDLNPEVPFVFSDKGQLQQVFLNILTNAIAAVGNRGKIEVRTYNSDKEKMVGIDIRDNGQGMSEEIQKHIFDPFFTTKRGEGTGLGLSITYGIVKKLKGHISFKSKEEEGTLFTILLPEEETYISIASEEEKN
ncbi:MAG: two-component sensor histidine kinase [Deltaproteobacteria bacterium]|nr:MAG: two-component sensor histidine kinase [Deltaproteobacteria bacterium]